MDKRATLINPDTGERRAIEQGSGGEQQSFAEGFKLETKSPESPPATYKTDAGQRTNLEVSGKTQQDLYASGYTPEVNLYESAFGTGADLTGATTSAQDAQKALNKVGDNIATEKASVANQITPQVTTPVTPEYKEYIDYTDELKKTREAGMTMLEQRKLNIQDDFKIRQEEQAISNRAETGRASMALAAMGAYGRSGSGIDYMKSVQVQNERELSKLLVQKQQLLIQAEEAFQKNDIDALSRIIGENTRITDQYNAIQSQILEDTLKTNQEIQRQTEFGWKKEDRAMEKISTLASIEMNYEDILPEQIADLEEQANLPEGTFKTIFDISKKAAERVSRLDDIEYTKELMSVLSNVPKSQVVQIGDDFYTGTKDMEWTMVTPKEGSPFLYGVDENGDIITKVLGTKGQGQPSSYNDKEIKNISTKLITSFKDGTYGGQCGSFVHRNVLNYPVGLNSLEEKRTQIDPGIGVGADQNLPQVGDVVIMNETSYYEDENGNQINAGHVAIINGFDSETGQMQLTESNYYDYEKVSTYRQINAQDSKVLGFFRGQLRPELNTEYESKATWDPTTAQWVESSGLTEAQKLAQQGKVEEQNKNVEIARAKLNDINDLMISSGLKGTVGSYWFSRWTPLSIDKAERQDFLAGVEMLVSQETIDTLINLKDRGGTLGALSDQERIMLRTAATKIGGWLLHDEDGKPTKVEISQGLFLKELQKIKDLTEKAINESGGATESIYEIGKVYEFEDSQGSLRQFKRIDGGWEPLT